MAAYIITYDLHKIGQNYQDLNDAIKSYNWAKVGTTSYVVTSSSHNSTDIRNKLKQYIDNNDKIIVAKLTGEAAWSGLPDEVSKWLKENI